ncbi:MAG: hypothetical protein LBH46_03840 [Rickettsiales bacterium]|nr:hypothetical protein [Rickettsiales bacterium]
MVLLVATSVANAALFDFKLNYEGKEYNLEVNSIDDLTKGDPADIMNMFKEQNKDFANAVGNSATLSDINSSEIEGLTLSVLGQEIEFKVDNIGGKKIKLVKDDLGLFKGIPGIESGIDFNDLGDLFEANTNDNLAAKLEKNIKDLIDSGKIYEVFSKMFVREEHNKIKNTPYSVVGGNPLSTMYTLADYDYSLAVNDEKIDSYSYPQIYYSSDANGITVLNARLPLNMHSDLFGLLDPLGLSLRFDLPISGYYITSEKNSDKFYGGSLGAGIALRWIVPEEWVSNWSITPSFRPFALSAGGSSRFLEVLDADELLKMEDLSIFPEISIFRSMGITSKKTFAATDFKIPVNNLDFVLTNSYTLVDSWGRDNIISVVNKFGALDDEMKGIIPEFDLHNSFFKNGLLVNWSPWKRLTLGGELTYTIVGGKTEVYVPTYWTFGFNLQANYSLWVFDTPVFRFSYTTGENNWNTYGLALRLNF